MALKRSASEERIDPSKAPRLDPLTTVVRNDLRHDDLDGDLEWFTGSNIVAPAEVLLEIARQAMPGRTKEFHTIQPSMVKDGQILDPRIRELVERKEYKTLRCLELFQLEKPRVEPRNPVWPQMPDVVKAWESEYQGSTHALLLTSLQTLYTDGNREDNGNHYRNQVSIIQSSGTGKSRMVHELSSLIFTIPFNLRDGQETAQGAYPHPDTVVRDFLTEVDLNDAIVEIRYMVFLKQLFICVRAAIAEMQVGDEKIHPLQWSQKLAENRTTLYANVVELARTELSQSPLETDDVHSSLQTAAAELSSSIGGEEGGLKMVLYLDEAHTLTKPRPGQPKFNFDIFCAAFTILHKLPFFALFLSTASQVSLFAPTQEAARSARARFAKIGPAPITEISFDCFLDSMNIGPGTLTHSDVIKIPFLAHFGRPLFKTLLRSRDDIFACDELIKLAATKLIHRTNSIGSQASISQAGRLAVLDVILFIRREQGYEATATIDDEMVSSHMRLAYSIPEHRTYMRSGYSSEPILAEAASALVAKYLTESPDFILETLITATKIGFTDCGELGELMGRMLLTLAYQKATQKSRTGGFYYSEGCKVTEFIEALFEEKLATEILECGPDNVRDGKSFYDAFECAKIRFTHFIKVADKSLITTALLAAAYIRGMAIICPDNNVAIDCIIPVLQFDTKICKHVMSAILVQFKLRAAAGAIARYSIDAETLKVRFFDSDKICSCCGQPETCRERPYLTIIMELGIKDPSQVKTARTTGKTTDKHSPTTAPAQPTTPSKIILPQPATRWTRTKSKKHPRYQIFAYGFSPNIYGVVARSATQAQALAFLLQKRDLVGEHPRPHTIPAIHMMKPVWKKGLGSFHWFNDPDLRGAQPEHEQPSMELEDSTIESDESGVHYLEGDDDQDEGEDYQDLDEDSSML